MAFKTKIIIQYLIITFSISTLCWGVCLACTQFDLLMENAQWLYILYIAGAASPAISSYLVLKNNHKVKGFNDWIKKLFQIKRPIWMYLLTVGLCCVYYVAMISVGGINEPKPLYMLLVYTPLMIVGGGHEEAGWRYILQPSLEKKWGFIPATICVGIIWAIWHFPLFHISGTGQYGSSFLIFFIYTIGTSFALGAICTITNSTFLCILFHCLFNAASTVISPNKTVLGAILATIFLTVFSFIAVYICNRNKKKQIYVKSTKVS